MMQLLQMVPQTSDRAKLVLVIALAVIALVLIVLFSIWGKKKSIQNKAESRQAQAPFSPATPGSLDETFEELNREEDEGK